MSQFTILVLVWGLGVITGRIYQYYIDWRQNEDVQD